MSEMASRDRRLTRKCRYVEGLINSLIIVTIFGLSVLGLASLVDIIAGVVR